ncbi:hypothetical protein FACS189425_06150 [Clostridia bacterium]|nr:hypothetical protein FACS189425_06150 [Clostridia bacterium]
MHESKNAQWYMDEYNRILKAVEDAEAVPAMKKEEGLTVDAYCPIEKRQAGLDVAIGHLLGLLTKMTFTGMSDAFLRKIGKCNKQSLRLRELEKREFELSKEGGKPFYQFLSSEIEEKKAHVDFEAEVHGDIVAFLVDSKILTPIAAKQQLQQLQEHSARRRGLHAMLEGLIARQGIWVMYNDAMSEYEAKIRAGRRKYL